MVGVSQAVVDVARRARCERVDGQPGEVESCREVPSRVVEGSGGLLGFCWAGQRVGSVEIGVSGTGWFLCDLKTASAIGTGPDGAGVVEAKMCQGPPVGARPWMTANRRVVHNASKPPRSPSELSQGTDCPPEGRGGSLERERGGVRGPGVDDLGLPAPQPQGKGTLIRAHPTTTVN